VGQSILINNLPFKVIGVAPREFFGADPGASPEVYVPLHASVLLETHVRYDPPTGRYADPNFEWILVMARLRPEVSAAQAQAALSPQWAQWIRTKNTARNRADLPVLMIKDGRGGVDGLRRTYSKPLYILLALVGLILALACANIANLLLARAAARRREVAVRLSIGAGRARVIRQLLTESVVMASISGALGIAFALWGIRVLSILMVNGREGFTPRADLNWRVLAVTAALSLATGLLFGLAPALRSTRVDLMPALKESQVGYPRGGWFRRLTLGRVLMVSQMGMSLIILVAALLFVRTLSNLEAVQLGFNRHNVLTFKLNARQTGRSVAESGRLYEDFRQRFAAIPGVRTAGLSNMPLIGEGRIMTMFSVAGGEPKGSYLLGTGPGFFAAMQVPILLGRAIDERDQRGAPLVAVVNQTFAKRNFGDRNPVGEHVARSECPECAIEIVGVSGNALHGKVTSHAVPAVYLPFAQGAWDRSGAMYELRTQGDPLRYVRAVREIVHQADAHLPVFEVQTQSALIDRTINQEITFARLCSGFAALALVIACVGLYGVMSYSVARRRSEIGIRMALGARKGRVVWMVLREVLALSAAALTVSVPAALFGSRLIGSFLFGTKPEDPFAYVAAACMLAAAAVSAGYLPARSAARIDPMGALRHE
jgi:predicted permease